MSFKDQRMHMKINILPHALKRMKERKITLADIESAVLFPDKLQTDRSYQHRMLAKKIISVFNKPYLLLVIFERHQQTITVITVISTSKILKYL